MSVRSTTDMIRHLVLTAHKVRHASTVPLPGASRKAKPEHGQQIFVYNHLQTKQVVYSLTKTLHNNAALRQLPFNGKKTVPRAIRKDLWYPLATISFPPGRGALGLSAFQKLRELRRLHETAWDPVDMMEEVEYKDGSSRMQPLTRRERGRKLMDQKANSVADMAVVLGTLGDGEGEVGEGEEQAQVQKEGGDVVVEVRWKDLVDAEYAETWPVSVIHDVLDGGSVGNAYGDAVRTAEESRASKPMLVEDAAKKKPEQLMA
ncbi:hypothetical protein D0Z07_6311 [Hyphodiscus hymeniophilus]|uniref:Large ribosomal subunit protein mL67 n=1 Tax=Hyphodiscus hymeniophilus TaxID=353542 RepID=A0A9P6VFC5_9HELO|nr:hypothetical protein D0Z07_6311 [Hyphodiscus hymeniophilus]